MRLGESRSVARSVGRSIGRSSHDTPPLVEDLVDRIYGRFCRICLCRVRATHFVSSHDFHVETNGRFFFSTYSSSGQDL